MNARRIIPVSHRRPHVERPVLLDDDLFEVIPIESEELDETEPQPMTIIDVPRMRALCKGHLK